VVEAYVASEGAELQPGELLAYLDTWVRRVGRGQFVMTAFAAVIEGRTGRVSYANAGHNFPYVLAKQNEKVAISALTHDGNLLGGPNPVVPNSFERQLSPGSKLVIFTDGVPEAGAPQLAEFSERRFRRSLQDLFDQPAEQVVKGIVQAVAEHCGDTPASDDLTLVVIDLPPGDQA
jgi:serine phosphatase RsbU (regulator of sigma subunit)